MCMYETGIHCKLVNNLHIHDSSQNKPRNFTGAKDSFCQKYNFVLNDMV